MKCCWRSVAVTNDLMDTSYELEQEPEGDSYIDSYIDPYIEYFDTSKINDYDLYKS